MITTKIEGFDRLADHLEQVSQSVQKLDGQTVRLTCNCGSTEFLVDDELGELAPVKCKGCGKVIGTEKDMKALVQKQAEEKLDQAVKNAFGG